MLSESVVERTVAHVLELEEEAGEDADRLRACATSLVCELLAASSRPIPMRRALPLAVAAYRLALIATGLDEERGSVPRLDLLTNHFVPPASSAHARASATWGVRDTAACERELLAVAQFRLPGLVARSDSPLPPFCAVAHPLPGHSDPKRQGEGASATLRPPLLFGNGPNKEDEERVLASPLASPTTN